MKISHLKNDFKRFCLVERGMTIRNYKGIVRYLDLIVVFANTENIKKIDEDTIREFLISRSEEKGWSSKTFRNYLQYYATFFSWCVKRRYLNKSPTENIEKPKLPKRLPRCLTQDHAIKILSHASWYNWFYEFERVRNVAMIAIFLLTGMRLNELLNLKVNDVSLDASEIFIEQGKGSKDRIVPIHPKLKLILRGYLKALRKKSISSIWLFTGVNSNKQLSPKDIHTICRKISISSEIKFTPHMLRHTFARLSINADLNIYKLKEIMGHSNVSTTQIYMSVSQESIKRSFNKLHLI